MRASGQITPFPTLTVVDINGDRKMKRSNWELGVRHGSVVLGLVASLALAGCGGGDDDGGGGSSPPEIAMLTLSGRVVDEPIPNAEVFVTVGDETFTTTADTLGDYAIDIELPETQTSSFVTLEARGVGDQSFVELFSLVGTFSELLAEAGADATLSAAENFAMQITNVTTAEGALLVQANGGTAITSQATRDALATTIDGANVLNLATALKLAIDSPDDYPLPDGFTTRSLAQDVGASNAFVVEAEEKNPEMFAETTVEIAGDPELTEPVPSGTPADMLASYLSTEAGFTFNTFNRILAVDFAEDGTGSVSDTFGTVGATWSVDGSTIILAYAEPAESISYPFVECDGQFRQVQARYTTNGLSLNKLSDRTLAVTETQQIDYLDCDSLEAETQTGTYARTLLKQADFLELGQADVAEAVQTLQVLDLSQNRLASDVAVFNEDGTGSTALLGQSFTWSLLADGRGLGMSFDNGTTATYRLLYAIDDYVSDGFFDLTTADGVRYIDAGASIDVDPDELPMVTAQDVPGRYYQFGVGDETIDDERLGGFRLRFDADFTGSQEDDYIAEDGSVQTDNASTYQYYFFRWEIDGMAVVVTRYQDSETADARCDPTTASCLLHDERRIVPLVVDGDRYYWIEIRKSGFPVTSSSPATYLSRFYDRVDLGQGATHKRGSVQRLVDGRGLAKRPH